MAALGSSAAGEPACRGSLLRLANELKLTSCGCPLAQCPQRGSAAVGTTGSRAQRAGGGGRGGPGEGGAGAGGAGGWSSPGGYSQVNKTPVQRVTPPHRPARISPDFPSQVLQPVGTSQAAFPTQAVKLAVMSALAQEEGPRISASSAQDPTLGPPKRARTIAEITAPWAQESLKVAFSGAALQCGVVRLPRPTASGVAADATAESKAAWMARMTSLLSGCFIAESQTRRGPEADAASGHAQLGTGFCDPKRKAGRDTRHPKIRSKEICIALTTRTIDTTRTMRREHGWSCVWGPLGDSIPACRRCLCVPATRFRCCVSKMSTRMPQAATSRSMRACPVMPLFCEVHVLKVWLRICGRVKCTPFITHRSHLEMSHLHV